MCLYVRMVDLAGSRGDNKPGLHVPWSGLTVALIVIAAASLGTLAVIVGIKDVDVLSTVALALAVLAFAAQLIVSLAQAQGAAHQLTQTERINSETQSALAEVKSTGHAMLANQSELFNKVLSAALHSATEDAVREVASQNDVDVTGNGLLHEPLNPEAIADRVEARLRSTLLGAMPSRHERPAIDWNHIALTESDGVAALETLKELTPAQTIFFTDRTRLGPISLTLPRHQEGIPTFYRPYVALGMMVLVNRRNDGPRRLALTEKGRQIAKLLHGGPDIYRNSWFRELLMREAGQAPLPGL